MPQRTFNRPATSGERDTSGHRVAMKVIIFIKVPMSDSGFRRWGRPARKHIHKSMWVLKPYGSSTALGFPDGIPTDVLANDKLLGEFLITHFYLMDGYEYHLHAWTPGKTRTHVKLTRSLATIRVHDAQDLKFDVTNTGRIGRYWFRRVKKKTGGDGFG